MENIRFSIFNYLRLCLGLTACLCFCLDTQAQDKEPEPDRPILERVSVHPLTGHVTIDWTVENPPKSPTATDEFIIFWFEPQPTPTQPNAGTNHFIARISNPNTRSYTFDYDTMTVRNPVMPDPRKTTVAFTVAAEHRTPYVSSLRSYEDYCLQVNSKYDSCRAEIRLFWHRYRGWTENTPPNKPLIGYRVMQIEDGTLPGKEIKTLSEQDTLYVFPNVNENETYTFYIEAISSDKNLTATSYKMTKTTTMPWQPAFIEATGTQYNSAGFAEISFKIDPASETQTYAFLGSSKPNYAFVTLETFNIRNDTTLTDIQTRERTYYYRLSAWHLCKNKYTAESNMATALWLSLRQDEQINFLQWDSYEEWGGDVRYELHRQIGGNPDEVIFTVTDPYATEYKDNLSGVLIDGDVCYWVTALPESSVSPEQFAISNVVRIIPESDIYTPQAFTPDGDGQNDEYKVFFSYPPEDFLLCIYDRIGAKLFETKNSDMGWDGNLKGSKPANEGVYSYYLKYRTARGRLVEKRGTFALIRH